jgi:hypothetical protein
MMDRSPYVEIALGLLVAGARPWEEPERCRQVVAGLREAGEVDLADQLERASRKSAPWPGSTAGG